MTSPFCHHYPPTAPPFSPRCYILSVRACVCGCLVSCSVVRVYACVSKSLCMCVHVRVCVCACVRACVRTRECMMCFIFEVLCVHFC